MKTVIQGTPRNSALPTAKCVVDVARLTTLGSVQIVAGQQHRQKLPKRGRSVHDIRQDEEPYPLEQEKYDKSFDSINIKCLIFDNVKSIIFSKLVSGTSKKRVHITCKIDSGSDSNLMLCKNL